MQDTAVIAQWERFELATIPSKTAPQIRADLKRAFYAGLLSQMQSQHALYMDLDPVTWAQKMRAAEDECRQFLAADAQERATRLEFNQTYQELRYE